MRVCFWQALTRQPSRLQKTKERKREGPKKREEKSTRMSKICGAQGREGDIREGQEREVKREAKQREGPKEEMGRRGTGTTEKRQEDATRDKVRR